MIEVDFISWKRAIEGCFRGYVGPFKQNNRVEPPDEIREYVDDDGNIVMRMRCIGSMSDTPGYEVERVFEVAQFIVDASCDVYVATQEDWDEWDNMSDEEAKNSYEWLRNKGIIE